MTREYSKIPIEECHETLIPIPLENFAVESPHPYAKLGAPYGDKSPYYLRQSLVDALIDAQEYLQQLHPGWKLQIFDAYRPVAVQQFMVDYTFTQAVQSQGLTPELLSSEQKEAIWQEVYKIWAVPSDNPLTPPPHSTGAAIDVTLVDDQGNVVDMGSPIDELSDRSLPDYYAQGSLPDLQQYHRHREILNQLMLKAGWRRNPREWWHFSLGDQMWGWLGNRSTPDSNFTARYGRVDF